MWYYILNRKSQNQIIKEEYDEFFNLHIESLATTMCPENLKGM